MRRISRRAVLCALGVATLAACGPGNGQVDLSATDAAVMAACARVVSVVESRNALDGLGTGLYYELRFDSKRRASVDDLDAIVAAIWQNSPFEPNGITLMAFSDEAQEVPVDLRVAAAGLEPVRFLSFGQGGVSLLGMWKRYGDWDDPT